MPDWGNAASVQRYIDEIERRERERLTALKLWRQGERTAGEVRPVRPVGADSPYAAQAQAESQRRQAEAQRRAQDSIYAEQIRQRIQEQQQRAMGDYRAGEIASQGPGRRTQSRPATPAISLPVQQVSGPIGQSGLGQAAPLSSSLAVDTVQSGWSAPQTQTGARGEGREATPTRQQPLAQAPQMQMMGGGAVWDKWVTDAVDWWRQSAAGQAAAQRWQAIVEPPKQEPLLPSMRTAEGWQQYGLMAASMPTTSEFVGNWLSEQAKNAEQPGWFRAVAAPLGKAVRNTPDIPQMMAFEYLPKILPGLAALWSKGADAADNTSIGKAALMAGGGLMTGLQAGDDTLKITPLPGKSEYTVGQFLSSLGRAVWDNPWLIVDGVFLGGRATHEAKMRYMEAYDRAAGGPGAAANGSPKQWALLNVYSDPKAVRATYDDLMMVENKAGVIAGLTQQAQQAQASGDALKAAEIGAQIEWWKNARPVDVVDKHTELLPELVFTMLFDWTNLIGFGFDLAKLGPQTRRMASAVKAATADEGTVLRSLEEAIATTQAARLRNGDSLLGAAKANAGEAFVGLTNEARATQQAADLFTFFTQLLGDVKSVEDARLLVAVAAQKPQELITGLRGLTGMGDVLQADGAYKVGAGLFNTRVIEAIPTLLEARQTLLNLPSLNAEKWNPLAALAEMHDALFASAYRVHGLADWAMPQGTKAVRAVDIAPGPMGMPQQAIEYLDEQGNVISRSAAMKQAEAQGEVNKLSRWIAEGRTENPAYTALRAPDRLVRGFISSAFLNLMPGHWVRNAVSGMGHLMTDGVMTFEKTDDAIGFIANQFGGALPLTWMREAFQATGEEGATASAKAMGAPARGSWWDWLGKGNLLSRADAAGSEVWTGGGAIAGRVPVGEMNMRLRGFVVPFRRGLQEEWGKVVTRQLGPVLDGLGVDGKTKRKLISAVVDAAVYGNKREVVPAVRRFLDGTASSVDMQALGLANGSISPDAYRTIRQVLDVYMTSGDRAAAERAINEALDAEQLLFARILADTPAQPGRQTFTELENVQDFGELLRDVEHAARKAGADPAEATRPVQELITQYKDMEPNGYAALMQLAAEQPTPQVRALLFDTWAQIYDAKIAARQRQGALARAAMEDPALWQVYPQQITEVWREFFTTQERLFQEAMGLMTEAQAGRYVSSAPAGSHGLLEKLASIDTDAAMRQMGQVPKGLHDPEYQAIIDAGRSFQDQAAATMYTVALRYGEDVNAFDHVISAEIDVRRMSAAAAAKRAEIAAKYPDLRNAKIKRQYYKEMSELWGDFWFATSGRYHAASMEITTEFVTRRLAPDASFVEPWADPFGRTLTLLEPVETAQGRRWRVLDMDKKTVADDLIAEDQIPPEAIQAWERAMSGPKVRQQAAEMVAQVHSEGRPATMPPPNAGAKPATMPDPWSGGTPEQVADAATRLANEAQQLQKRLDDLAEEAAAIVELLRRRLGGSDDAAMGEPPTPKPPTGGAPAAPVPPSQGSQLPSVRGLLSGPTIGEGLKLLPAPRSVAPTGPVQGTAADSSLVARLQQRLDDIEQEKAFYRELLMDVESRSGLRGEVQFQDAPRVPTKEEIAQIGQDVRGTVEVYTGEPSVSQETLTPAASAPLTRPESMRAAFAPGDQVQLPNGKTATVKSATATSVTVEVQTKTGKPQTKRFKPENVTLVERAAPPAKTVEEGMALAAEPTASREQLEAAGMVRKWGNRWQYNVQGTWLYANSEEDAVRTAAARYQQPSAIKTGDSVTLPDGETGTVIEVAPVAGRDVAIVDADDGSVRVAYVSKVGTAPDSPRFGNVSAQAASEYPESYRYATHEVDLGALGRHPVRVVAQSDNLLVLRMLDEGPKLEPGTTDRYWFVGREVAFEPDENGWSAWLEGETIPLGNLQEISEATRMRLQGMPSLYDQATQTQLPSTGGIQTAESGSRIDVGGSDAGLQIADTTRAGGANETPLAGVSAADVRGVAAERGVGGDTDAVRTADAGSVPGVDQTGDVGARGVGADAPRVGVSTSGETGSGGGARGGDRAKRAPADVERAIPRAADNTADQPITHAPTTARGRDYLISEGDNLDDTGSSLNRYRNNVEAIKVLKQIETEKRMATPAEQAILARYTGWGDSTLRENVFYNRPWSETGKQWQPRAQELRGLLSDDEWKAASASSLNAHYTKPTVIKAMYTMLDRLGFGRMTTKRILEPAAGIGNFYGLMPSEWLAGAMRTAVEKDDLTGRILRQLYQNVDVNIAGFENTTLPKNYYDLVISNFPFGDIKIFDPELSKGADRWKTSAIHNYFFVKSLDQVRPGGMIAAITSHYTMDGLEAEKLRAYLAEQADLVAAIRLPNNTFKSNANTEVVTDIIFLRKRLPGEAPNGVAWTKVREMQIDGQPYRVNEYFHDHPEMVLGQHSGKGSMYGANEYTVQADGDLAEALARVVDQLPQNIVRNALDDELAVSTARRVADHAEQMERTRIAAATKLNSHVVVDGKVMKRTASGLEAVTADSKTQDRIKRMLEIRDTAREILRIQRTSQEDAEFAPLMTKLNQQYDAFRQQYGALNEQANVRAMADDPDGWFLQGLERGVEVDDKTNWEKMDIFRQRVAQPYVAPTRAETPKQALLIALRETNRPDPVRIAELLGVERIEDAMQQLGDLVYRNPGGSWETADQYLSGDVRKKLAQAEAAARNDPTYQRNVEALRQALPADKPPERIGVRLGSPWVPAEYYNEFLATKLGLRPGSVEVRYEPTAAVWEVVARTKYVDTAENLHVWGVGERNGLELVQDTLNGVQIQVYTGSGKDRALNPALTTQAQMKMQKLQQEFRQWLWAEPERADQLARLYNDTHNNIVRRQFDGSHLEFPRMNPAVNLHQWQRDGVWRVLQNPNTLLAYDVGLGKTFTMVASAMEMRRTGLARKPLFAVPKDILQGFVNDARLLYPDAAILSLTESDFTPARRNQTMSRIATGDWDMVVITHDNLEAIPLRPEFQEGFLRKAVEELREVLTTVLMQADADKRSVQKAGKGARRNPIARQIENRIANYEAKLQALSDIKRDNTIFFDELGVDALFVDEAHLYKNLFFPTMRQNVKGIPNNDTQRSWDMFMKIQYIHQQTNGRNVVFATGTPVSNSITEVYSMMKYLMPEMLEQRGLHNFDAWAATFGQMAADWERTTTGEYKVVERFAKFDNIPELRQLLGLAVDRVRLQDVESGLKLPKLRTEFVVSPKDHAVARFLDWIKERAKALTGFKAEKGEDNHLKIANDMRLASVDMRILFPSLPMAEDSKLNQVVRNVVEVYQRTTPDRGTQMIFCDLGTPQPGRTGPMAVYDNLKRMLIEAGIPEHEIAYVHDFQGDSKAAKAAKQRMLREMQNGDIRVLFASTGKGGTGINVQRRLAAQHHVDILWNPMPVEQRLGRMVRQGNMNDEVTAYFYLQEPIDQLFYGRLKQKQAALDVLWGRDDIDEIGEVGEGLNIGYGEAEALASGDPDVLNLVRYEKELSDLEAMQAANAVQAGKMQRDVRTTQQEIEAAELAIERLSAATTTTSQHPAKAPFEIGGQLFEGDERKELVAWLDSWLASANWEGKLANPRVKGTYKGLAVTVEAAELSGSRVFNVVLEHNRQVIYNVTGINNGDGVVRRINAVINGLADDVKAQQDFARTKRARLENLQAQAKVEMSEGDMARYAELRAEIDRIRQKLARESTAVQEAGAAGADVTVRPEGMIDLDNVPVMEEKDIPFGAAGIMLRPGVPLEIKALWAKLRKAQAAGPTTAAPAARPKHNFGGVADLWPASLWDVMSRNDKRIGMAGNLRQPTIGDVAAFRVEDIDQLRRRLLNELDNLTAAPNTLTNQQKLQVLGAVQQLMPQYDNVLAGVTKGAQQISDFAMLDYGKVHGFDTAIALHTPFHFWFTRSAKNWLERSLLKPSVLASYLRIKRAIDQQNERENTPARMSGTIGIPGTQIRIANPYNLLIPYQTLYELSDFGEETPNPTAVQRFVETAKLLGFGMNPLYDSLYKVANGRGQEIQAGDFAPQYRLINYLYKTLTGNELPGAGDEYDPYRDARTLARMVQAGAIDQNTARWLQDRLYQRANGVEPLPEEAAQEKAIWDRLTQEAAQASGFERLVPLLTRSLLGVTAYSLPQEEQDIRQMQAARRGLGYGPDNAFGSQAAVDAFDAQSGYDQVQGAWMGKDALIPQTPGAQTPAPPTYPFRQPYTPTRPGVAAVDAQKKEAKAAIRAEMNAAVEAALAENPRMTPAQLKELKAPFYDRLDALDLAYPSATNWAEQGPRDFYGNMNPAELLESARQSIVYRALDELAPMKPQAGAPRQAWDAYNAALEQRVAELMNDPQALSAEVYGRPVDVGAMGEGRGATPMPMSPAAPALPTAGSVSQETPVASPGVKTPVVRPGQRSEAQALIDSVLGKNTTPAEQAYWERRDAEFAAKDAMWAQRKATVYATFGEDVGKAYEEYLALPSGGQARKDYKAQHPELRAVSLLVYHPQEYGQMAELFGQDGITAWAKLPPASDRKARAAYYDANPKAFLVQAWVYGRPGKQDEQDTAADEAFRYNFGADYKTAEEKFGADIWQVVAGYRRGWDKATKAAYYRQNAQLSPFFDWWYGNLDEQPSVSPYANVGRAWSGGGGGGWSGGGGWRPQVRMPEVWAREMDRSLWNTDTSRYAYQPPRVDLSWLRAGDRVGPEPIRKWRRERLW